MMIKIFNKNPKKIIEPRIVTFTGGMGAQILSAAIYFERLERQLPVYADMSYFEKEQSIAQVGEIGKVSQWAWALDVFNLKISDFLAPPHHEIRKENFLHDGERKLSLALDALRRVSIRRKFPIPLISYDALVGIDQSRYACIHIRRGDYKNVASHLVADAEFVAISKKIGKLIDSVVVLSDSPIEHELRNNIESHFKCAAFLDNVDAVVSHCIMRRACIMVCSNSQFSLVGAILNPDALIFIPRQWFGGDHRSIEAPLHSLCDFELLTA